MPEPTNNLGVTKRWVIYVEDSKLGRDYAKIKNATWKPKYVEWDDEYLGDGVEKPGQRCTGAIGSFETDESDAKYSNDIEQAIRNVERSGRTPKIVLVEETRSNTGTISKVFFRNATMQSEPSTPGKNEKVNRKYTWRSSPPETE